MGKISPVSSKYIIHAQIDIEGVVDRPDVIGAIFGQTEGLLGADLELRELQRSGRIGRIEVTTETRSGKTSGKIIIPSSLDKAETAIVGAALEIIQRIGPCNAKIKVGHIEDIRISKRQFVVERAKELLSKLITTMQPDSQELADEVAHSVRVMEIREFGKDRLPAGPGIEESDEIIVVEGRADVINLLKHGFKNAIAMNGTSCPQTIINITKEKNTVVFVDGDRGGDLNVKELLQVAEIDFVTRAPDGKEVEELTQKEIHKALRGRISAEQAKLEYSKYTESLRQHHPRYAQRHHEKPTTRQGGHRSAPQKPSSPPQQRIIVSAEQKKMFRGMLEDLIGTKGAYFLDAKMRKLGKVPITELAATIKSLSTGVHALVLDGPIDKSLVQIAERAYVKFLVGMDTKVKQNETRMRILTINDL
ncbi:MAG: DNA primase DnaG [Nanoarchaeota archaeon]|nr:DNA primase DnaG [Nanoarchaeota archaeon]